MRIWDKKLYTVSLFGKLFQEEEGKQERERERGKAKAVLGFMWRMFLWAVGLNSSRNWEPEELEFGTFLHTPVAQISRMYMGTI